MNLTKLLLQDLNNYPPFDKLKGIWSKSAIVIIRVRTLGISHRIDY
jgi:hypothetical protein